MSVQRLLSAAGLAAATVASAQTTELVSFGPAFFDEGGFVYSAFAEEGAVSFTDDSLILEATGFGGIAAPLDPPLGFEPTLHELHVTARRLPGNTAQNLRVALRDEDGGDAIEEYVYNFPVASFGADGFTTQAVPVPGYAFRNAGPSITPGAPDGDGKQNFGLIRWQLQSQFGVSTTLNVEVRTIELVPLEEVALLDFGTAFSGFTFGSFQSAGAVTYHADTIVIDTAGSGGIGRNVNATIPDNDAYRVAVRARVLPGNEAQIFNVLLRESDGDDSAPGLGSEEYIYTFSTADLTGEFAVLEIGIEDYAQRQQAFGSAHDGDGVPNFGLFQVQLQNPPGGNPAPRLRIEVDGVFFARAAESEEPTADFDGDGAVNVNDLLGFLGAFRNQDAAADFDRNGSVNVNDLLAFLGAFRNA